MFHVMHWFSCNGFIVRKFHPMILAFHRHPRSRPRFFKHLCNPIMYLPWYPHTKCSPPIMVGLSECSFLSAVSNSDATEYCNGYVSMKIGVWSLVFGILPRWVAKVPGPQEPKSHRLWAEKTDNAFQFVKFCSKPLKDFLYTFVSGDGEVWCQDMSRKAAPPPFFFHLWPTEFSWWVWDRHSSHRPQIQCCGCRFGVEFVCEQKSNKYMLYSNSCWDAASSWFTDPVRQAQPEECKTKTRHRFVTSLGTDHHVTFPRMPILGILREKNLRQKTKSLPNLHQVDSDVSRPVDDDDSKWEDNVEKLWLAKIVGLFLGPKILWFSQKQSVTRDLVLVHGILFPKCGI